MQRSEALNAIKQAVLKPLKVKEKIAISKNKVVINTSGLSKINQDKLKALLKEIEILLEK